VKEILLSNNFPIVDTCLSCEDIARQFVQWCADGEFLRHVFLGSRVQHISDLHSKFVLRQHHVWKYGSVQCAMAGNRRGKNERRKKKPQLQNEMACSIGRP